MAPTRRPLVPMLDGQRVFVVPAAGARRHAFADGAPVPAEREADVLYVGEDDSARWWTSPVVVDAVGVIEPVGLEVTLPYADEPQTVTVGDETFTSNDVASFLSSLPSPTLAPPTAVEPGFFHRTLRAWLGEEVRPERSIVWPYGFWAASVDEISLDEPPQTGARAFEARVYRGDNAAPASFRYWLVFDDQGAIAASGWLGDAPDLLAEDAAAFAEPREVSAEQLFSLVDES